MEVTNIGVQRFWSLLKSKSQKENFQVFQLVQVNKLKFGKSHFVRHESSRLKQLASQYRSVSRDELPDGLPPERVVCPKIEVESNVKPLHRALFQLSSAAAMKAGKKKDGTSFEGWWTIKRWVVLQKEKMRNYPFRMRFLTGWEANYLSKLDLKECFHEVRVVPQDIGKTTFNTDYGQFEYFVMSLGFCNALATF